MVDLYETLGISPATYYRWRKNVTGTRKKPGPEGPPPEILDAMRDEVKTLRHVKRRTYGVDYAFDLFSGIIPRRVIQETINEERLKKNRRERRNMLRYEFIAPQLAWSADFIKVNPAGEVLRVQDERSRCVLGFEMKDPWTDIEVTRFVHQAIQRYGAPMFFKHDLGSVFTSGVFQAMLRAARVMALPNPPYYAPFNGKHERTNGSVRQWLLPLMAQFPTKEEIAAEMREALVDHNEDRRKDALGKRTPKDVYLNDPRLNLDRQKLYVRWDQLREKILTRRKEHQGGEDTLREVEAMRLAAFVVINENKLVRYSRGKEAPEV
jgi:transposase InsO family protein